jgi:acetyltransferase-like isoleucine patch superfamily enzyme
MSMLKQKPLYIIVYSVNYFEYPRIKPRNGLLRYIIRTSRNASLGERPLFMSGVQYRGAVIIGERSLFMSGVQYRGAVSIGERSLFMSGVQNREAVIIGEGSLFMSGVQNREAVIIY